MGDLGPLVSGNDLKAGLKKARADGDLTASTCGTGTAICTWALGWFCLIPSRRAIEVRVCSLSRYLPLPLDVEVGASLEDADFHAHLEDGLEMLGRVGLWEHGTELHAEAAGLGRTLIDFAMFAQSAIWF